MKTQSMNKRITTARTKRSPLICLLLLLGCLAQSEVRADTYVCGIAMGTWTKANSPYVLTCDVLVADLVIEPGVTVAASNYTFEVAGVLTAIDTANEPIVFMARNPAVGWQGIFFNYSSPGSEMRYCVISNSVNSGVRVARSLPYFDHCTIANNTSASGHGGGIYASIVEGNLVFRNCTIANNTALYYGGGIAAWVSTNTLVMECCQIQANTANPGGRAGTYYGGGVFVTGGLRMGDCLVTANSLYGCAENWATRYAYGGGVYAEGRAEISNCNFRGNLAREWGCGSWNAAYAYGGGMMASGAGPLSVVNSIFSHNTCSGDSGSYSGGLYINGSVISSRTVNCTFAYNNIEGVYSAASSATVMNSILFFNAGGGTQIIGTTNVTYCDVQGGFTGTGNINFSPIFHSQTNLVIVPGSRCVDAGSPATAYNDACFDGNSYGASYSLGGVRNDMSAHGGPGACCWECGSCTIPIIRTQPQPTTACVGSSASFSVGATGSQPLSYQWRFHGTNCAGAAVDISGATNATYTISNVQSNNAGCYSVRVSNPLGSVASAPARLTVTPVCVGIDLYAGLTLSGGIPGQKYRILSTLDLTEPVTWTSNTSFTMPAGGLLWLDTNSPANKPKKFYLVIP